MADEPTAPSAKYLGHIPLGFDDDGRPLDCRVDGQPWPCPDAILARHEATHYGFEDVVAFFKARGNTQIDSFASTDLELVVATKGLLTERIEVVVIDGVEFKITIERT